MENDTPNSEAEQGSIADHAHAPEQKTQESLGKIHHVWHDLKPRVISALIMLAVFLFSVTVGGWLFNGLVVAAALLMIREWDFLVAGKSNKWGWYGIAYISIAASSLIWLRNYTTFNNEHIGMGLVIFIIAIVIATDVCAYFVGKKFGRTKLAPRISPGKTWEGLVGGVAGAALVGLLCASLTPEPDTLAKTIILAMLLAFVAQAGDLFESHIKREAGVKDSGQLIQGHGGVLDRFDGILTAAPAYAIFITLSA